MGEKSPPKLVLLFVITLTYGWRAFPSSQRRGILRDHNYEVLYLGGEFLEPFA